MQKSKSIIPDPPKTEGEDFKPEVNSVIEKLGDLHYLSVTGWFKNPADLFDSLEKLIAYFFIGVKIIKKHDYDKYGLDQFEGGVREGKLTVFHDKDKQIEDLTKFGIERNTMAQFFKERGDAAIKLLHDMLTPEKLQELFPHEEKIAANTVTVEDITPLSADPASDGTV